MNESKLKRRLNLLTFYIVLSNIVFLLFFLTAFKNGERKENLDELTVKRINIVDETGKNLRMVISNESRQHSGIINGEKIPERQRQSGMIFFNSFGDECGGLIYDGNSTDAGLVLSIDKYRDDQIMQLQYMEDTKTSERKYGLQLWDYPKENSYSERIRKFSEIDKMQSNNERNQAYKKMRLDSLLMEERLFIGKDFNQYVGLFIKDRNGKPRIKIYIDENDNPKLEFLDNEGKIIK